MVSEGAKPSTETTTGQWLGGRCYSVTIAHGAVRMTNQNLGVYAVGKPFPFPELALQPGFGWYPNPDGGHLWVLIVDRPTPRELDELRNNLRVAVVRYSDVLMTVLVIPGVMQIDCPWTPDPTEVPIWETPTLQIRSVVNFIVVNHGTGLIEHMRMVTLPPHVSRVLRDEMAALAANGPVGQEEQLRRLAAYNERFPLVADALPYALASGRIGNRTGRRKKN